MSDLDISRLQNRAHAKGYAAGLDAAREAVAYYTVPRIGQPTVLEWLNGPSEVLAAIDALKGESNG